MSTVKHLNLGAEVDKPWFQNQFKIEQGKKIFDENGTLVSIYVNKRNFNKDKPQRVDEATGATVTADGVTKFLRDLMRYETFLVGQR